MNREKIMTFVKKSLKFLPDRIYVKLYYRMRVGRKLDVNNPKTLNEKLQWLKFNYCFPLQSVVSDKLLVREYVKQKIGEQYLIPLLGKWKKYEDIDFNQLPNKFVLKCNHDSGGLVVCTDKDKLNYSIAKNKIEKSLNSNFFYIGREHQYRNIKPMILCEKFISDNGKVPMDYKIYCFNGEPDVILVCKDRFAGNTHRAKYYFYDHKWKFIPLNKGDDNISNPEIPCPKNLDEMIEIAKELSKDFIFSRIDLYNIDGKIYFGEITLSPNSGFDADITRKTDIMFGKKLEIPYWDKIDRRI
jgi:hypothetical protein